MVSNIINNWQGDGKPFWRLVVSDATGCDSDNYFEEVYKVNFLRLSCSNKLLHQNSCCVAQELLKNVSILYSWNILVIEFYQLFSISSIVFAFISTMQMVMHGIFQMEPMKQCPFWKILEVIKYLLELLHV